MNDIIAQQKALNKKGWKILLLSMLAVAGAVIVQIVGYIAAMLLRLPEEGLAFTTMTQLISAGSVVLVMLVLGGGAWLKLSRTDFKETFSITWPLIALDVVLLAFSCVSFVAEGMTVAPDWLPKLGITALLCIGIGVMEEVLYRGILLNSVLAVTGRSHRGTMAGIMFVSLMFGFAHVDFSTDFASPLLATQAVLKIVQTGFFSIILCSVVLRTRSLGGAALVHGLSDFLLMIPSLVLAGQQVTTNYVSSGEEGVTSIVLYLIIIACYLPMTIKSLRSMHHERITTRGVFMERALQKQAQRAQIPAPPAPSAGLPTAA